MELNSIKFRGKVKTSKSYKEEGDWVYGNLVKIPFYKHHEKFSIIEDWIWAIQTKVPYNTPMGYTYENYEVYPETIGQYLGIDSSNGEELYSDDVVDAFGGEEYYGNWEHSICNHVITGRYDDLVFDVEYVGAMEKVILLGNIHDNPELNKASIRNGKSGDIEPDEDSF